MTALLASVRSAEEAETVVAAGADIVDLKDPDRGALGALPDATIERIVARVAGRRPVSATCGDLPMEPALVLDTVERMAGLGLDFVKVGFFPGGDLGGCLEALGGLAVRGTRIVAVLFADRRPDLDLIAALSARGFAGVMLDTADKRRGGLRAHVDEQALNAFVERARAAGLFTGLAGSLRLADVAPLSALGPDYLGFRGALTAGGRGDPVDRGAVETLRAALDDQLSSDSRASALAGAQQAARSAMAASPDTRLAKSR